MVRASSNVQDSRIRVSEMRGNLWQAWADYVAANPDTTYEEVIAALSGAAEQAAGILLKQHTTIGRILPADG